ncbi:MAG: mandelate racemase/muconate lactonizing enzyme family protein, partial [Trueperaceae bacterium]
KLERLEHVLVHVETENGHVGYAEAPARPTIYGETPQSIEAIIQAHLAPKLVGVDVQDETKLWNVLHSVTNNHTARGALDIALCETRAKNKGSSLFETTKGKEEKIRASFILGINDMATMVKEARTVFNAGVRVFKIKIGRDATHDKEIVTTLHHEFSGDDVTLYADANEGLSANSAAKDLERLANLGLAYVEEPLPVQQIKARAALKRENILPIIADDSCFTLRDLERELEFDTFDILNIKTARTGFTESGKMLELAKTTAKGVMIGSQAGSGLGTLHAAVFASKDGVTHPSELSFTLKLLEDVLVSPIQFKDGYVGLESLRGAQLKPRFLAKLRKSRQSKDY